MTETATAELTFVLRTADVTRTAEVQLPGLMSASELIQSAVENWQLPPDVDYTLVNTTNGRSIPPGSTMDSCGIDPGDVLELQPILVAG